MRMHELLKNFKETEKLFDEIDNLAPAGKPSIDDLRATFAGLLVVSLASCYESCVKNILIDYADQHHDKFSYFVERQFEKINSKISISDLNSYAKKFDINIYNKFKRELNKAENRLGNSNISNKYKQILNWRHAFAHAGEKLTTIEEARTFHRYGKFVILAFGRAFI
ncbi:HEPN domain-containing protein [Lonsdalea quercina]|uniref:HEPN domain-containing protein n=1 Tax=Lonsdalea quercina TaxID=71657 RepID=UPI0039771F16